MEDAIRKYQIQMYVFDAAMKDIPIWNIESGLREKFGALHKLEDEDAPINALTIACGNNFSKDQIEVCLRPHTGDIGSIIHIAKIIRDFKLSAAQVEELCFSFNLRGAKFRLGSAYCKTIYNTLKYVSYDFLKAYIKFGLACGYDYKKLTQMLKRLQNSKYNDFETSLYIEYANITDDPCRLMQLEHILSNVHLDKLLVDESLIKLYTDVSLTFNEASVIREAVRNLSADRARSVAQLIKRTKSGSI